METVEEEVKLKIPEHLQILRIIKRDEFGDKTVNVEISEMRVIKTIITMYCVFSRLIYSSQLPVRFIIISTLQKRKLKPRKAWALPKVTQLTGAWNLNFKPMLFITAPCCLSQGARSCNQRKKVNSWRESCLRLRSLKGIHLLLSGTFQISPSTLGNFFQITRSSHL